MRVEDFRALLAKCPVIPSVQADEGTPLDSPDHLSALGKASLASGAAIVRLQGIHNIDLVARALDVPVIGLIKRHFESSPVYITPTSEDVQALLQSGCEIVSLDATTRPRPFGESLLSLIEMIHRGGKLAMADCDSPSSVDYAIECGADILASTLSGYTDESPKQSGPDLDLVRYMASTGLPAIAEGRYSEVWQVRSARMIGADAVVIGAALNDPIKQTARFRDAATVGAESIGAVDIGGTWLRFGAFDPKGKLLRSERIPTPAKSVDRLDWISERIEEHGIRRLGIATGGTVDPASKTVIESKPIIPDNLGCDFTLLEVRHRLERLIALNDGLATAWGHYCHPMFAGGRIATLALGTGVGFGVVDRGRLLMGSDGSYPRFNDLPTSFGSSFEEMLGGASLGESTSASDRESAGNAAAEAVARIRALYFPDQIVLCGGVGLGGLLDLGLPVSPFGEDAGLYGAAAMVRFEPF